MTTQEIMTQLAAYGSESIKKVLLKHGVKEPFFGVKVEHLKVIQKKIKKDYTIANELFHTGNADAMYLAGLIADDDKMTAADLQSWAEKAVSQNISEYTVPWVAAASHHGLELALRWIDSKTDHIAASGWSTLGGLAALKPDTELDAALFTKLIDRVAKSIHKAGNRERYAMNSFLISVGVYFPALTSHALAVAATIGTITVDDNGTACKVPDAAEYINKSIAKGQHGKKKKTLKC
jgi:3-methyladenine DNA glycosylase AlkD